jgi:hypothetical protein
MTLLQQAVVEVDNFTLARSDLGSITGVIYIRSEAECFPGTACTDFSVIILDWWLSPIHRVVRDQTRIWDCQFMDGPCLVRLQKREGDHWDLTALHNDRPQFAISVSGVAFIRSLWEAARATVAACEERGWQSRDIDSLSSTVRMLKNDVASYCGPPIP